MGSIWARQDPGGPHVGPMNFAIWEPSQYTLRTCYMGKESRRWKADEKPNDIGSPMLTIRRLNQVFQGILLS